MKETDSIHKLKKENARLKQEISYYKDQLKLSENEEFSAINEELKEKNEEYAALNEEYAAANEELSEKNKEIQAINDALLESEEKLSKIIENAADAIFISDFQGSFILVNQQACKSLGYKKEEFSELQILDIDADHTNPKAVKEKLDILEKDGFVHFESHHKRKDGSVFPVDIRLGLMHDKGKKVIINIARDISAWKQAEAALKESEEKYRVMIETSPDPVVTSDLKGDITYVSDAMLKCYGYNSADEIIGKSAFDLIHQDDRDKALSNLEKTFKEGKFLDAEYTSIRKNGELFHTLLSASVIHNAKNEPTGFIAVIKDISRLKKIQHELVTAKQMAEKSEAKSNSLISAIPDMMFVFNKDGIITDYHTEEETRLYAKPGQFVNKKIDDVLPGYIVKLTYKAIKEVLETGKTFEYEYELPINDEISFFNARMVYLNKNSTLSIVRDITQAKQAKQEIIKAKEKAEESDRLKTAFLANMSHEIRTPMNGIVGFAELLREGNLPLNKSQKYIDIICSNGEYLLQLINDIIDAAKIEANQLNIGNNSFNLNQLLNEIFVLFKTDHEYQRKERVNLILDQKTDEPFTIMSDETRIKQIINNLINNAIKFTDEGEVHFGYKLQADDNLLFYVSDTGIGIPIDYQDKIFSRFWQAETGDDKKHGGTGLGLAISKGLIELLGGDIWFDSEPNTGTTFYFNIPYKKDKSLNLNNKTLDNKLIDFTNKKILIADDENTVFYYLSEVITPTGAIIIRAENGLKAIEAVNQNPDIKLILMDLKMPVMDGFEATKKIKAANPDIKIIAQTAYAAPDDKEKALNAGCDDYITKPIYKYSLLNMLAKYLS
jgi:hypothetical protein